ncbi:hypothetical protein Nepgr_014638 [Nepenthes gracilis]|uniref:Uncharacterized protein n=1 Tax=Nepenthes gracilis TaxID=150966 RepID=A0AAD3SLP6_NEPGR|nr:hypothetical protein Nepgr_014638 [Nepenthes gracilis]
MDLLSCQKGRARPLVIPPSMEGKAFAVLNASHEQGRLPSTAITTINESSGALMTVNSDQQPLDFSTNEIKEGSGASFATIGFDDRLASRIGIIP